MFNYSNSGKNNCNKYYYVVHKECQGRHTNMRSLAEWPLISIFSIFFHFSVEMFICVPFFRPMLALLLLIQKEHFFALCSYKKIIFSSSGALLPWQYYFFNSIFFILCLSVLFSICRYSQILHQRQSDLLSTYLITLLL